MWKQLAVALGLLKGDKNAPTEITKDETGASKPIVGPPAQDGVGLNDQGGAGSNPARVRPVPPTVPGRPLLDLLGKSEGTDRGDGYNETLAYGALVDSIKTPKGRRNHVDLTSMTLDQIDAIQTVMLADPDNNMNSSALGRYQIVRRTLRALRAKLPTKGSDKFDGPMQDYLGQRLLDDRGFSAWKAGHMTDDDFINSICKEWASLPTTKGKGYYGGQNAGVTVAEVRAALKKCKTT